MNEFNEAIFKTKADNIFVKLYTSVMKMDLSKPIGLMDICGVLIGRTHNGLPFVMIPMPLNCVGASRVLSLRDFCAVSRRF